MTPKGRSEAFMRRLRSLHVTKASLTCFFLLLLAMAATGAFLPTLLPPVEAATPVIYMTPSVTSGNPGGAYINVDINVADVEDLYLWNLRIKKPLGPLSPLDAVQGPFLKQGGQTEFSDVLYGDHLAVVCNLVGQTPGVSGTGVLATITFEVIDTGDCTIKPYDTGLIGIDLGPPADTYDIPHSVGSSKFYTTYPVAVEIEAEPYTNYFYTPNPTQTGHPVVNEPLLFNGSACYDPDQSYKGQTGSGIVSYRWDFGDGNVTTVSDPVLTHVYAENRTHVGSLTVTDDDGETDEETFSVDVRLHDIRILNVTATPAEVHPGGIVNINVTVLNEGTMSAYFNVSVYYDDSLIRMELFKQVWLNPQSGVPRIRPFLEPEENATMSWNPDPISKEFEPLAWNTTGVAPGTYTIKAHVYLVDQAHTNETLDGIEEDLADNTFTDCQATILSHNIAITDVTASPDKVSVGHTVYINVTVTNEGDFTESFDVTTYYDATAIDTQPVTDLAAEGKTTLEFEWDTTDVDVGEYTIRAEASEVVNETRTDDNAKTFGVVRVRQPGAPTADFTYSPDEPPVIDIDEEVTFNASASADDDGHIVSYAWAFGDDTTAIYVEGENLTAIANHTYTVSGEYRVTLNVTDNDGLWDAVSRDVTVYAPPVANFTFSPSEPVVDAPVTFNATASYDPDGGNVTFPSGIISYAWDFDDGTGTGNVTEHTYTDAGEYSVTLTVTDDEGMTNDTTATVTVSAALVHDVAVIDVTPNPTVAAPGQSVSITVNVKNKGDFAETFNVTAYYDANPIGTKTITLDPDATGSPTITWDTTFVVEGVYAISANASVVDGETYTADNSYTDGTVTVQRQVGPGQMLAIAFSGEREYFEDDDVKIRLAALVRYADTMEPLSNAAVDIMIYNPEGALWNSSSMVERLAGTGIYEWESSDTIVELELEKGFYLIHVQARLGALEASEISQFHIASVVKTSSIISLEVNSNSITIGASVTLSGAITPNRPSATVTILYRSKGGDWAELGTAKTSTASHYSLGWVVTTASTYEVKASWVGDTRTEGAESEVKTATVNPAGWMSPELLPYVLVSIAAIAGSIVGSLAAALILMRMRKPEPS